MTAHSPALSNVVVSRPGIAEGPATGLIFSSPGNDLFQLQINSLTTSGCQALAGAGFFNGSQDARRNHFQR